MKTIVTHDDHDPPLTESQLAQLQAAEHRVPDTDDIPETTAESWKSARSFHRPLKEPISIRVDVDVLQWLRGGHDRYQTEINRILRREMEAQRAVADA